MKKSGTSLKALAICFSLVLFATAVFAQSTDCSGNWKLSQKTSLSGIDYANSIPNQIKVKQADNNIDIARTTQTPGQEDHVTHESLTMDSKPNEHNISTDTRKTTVIQWSADKRSFTENAVYADLSKNGRIKYKISETWSLSADGGALTINRNFENPNDLDDKWSVKGDYNKE